MAKKAAASARPEPDQPSDEQQTTDDDVFSDVDDDDAYAEGDEHINWDKVEEVADAFNAIEQIEDPEERRRAAADYHAVMAAEATTNASDI